MDKTSKEAFKITEFIGETSAHAIAAIRSGGLVDELELKIQQLQVELKEAKKLKVFILNTFKQHAGNKWNWSDEDVVSILRHCVMSNEEWEIMVRSK